MQLFASGDVDAAPGARNTSSDAIDVPRCGSSVPGIYPTAGAVPAGRAGASATGYECAVLKTVSDSAELHSRLGEPTSHSSCDLPETRGCPKRHERPAPPWTGWPRDSQRGWSAGVRVGQVDRQGELLEAIGLDEFLLCRCPGGEGERHDPAPLSSEHRLHVGGKDRPCRGYP